jgi:hypothetical protein
MPVLGSDTYGNRKRLARAFEKVTAATEIAPQLSRKPCATEEAELFGSPVAQDPVNSRRYQVHSRRTLDRFGYSMLSSTETRDRDQVSYRWAANGMGGQRLKRSARPIIMVDQLWLWMLEDGKISLRDFVVNYPSLMLTITATQGPS